MSPTEAEKPAHWGAFQSYRTLARELKALPWRTAAPSWVVPGTVADSCRFLDGLVDEVALLFLETAGSLAYTRADLPTPAEMGLEHDMGFHVHLPLDLPWRDGPKAAADACLALAGRAAHLAPRRFVLHPPQDPEAMAAFAGAFRSGCDAPLLLENTEAVAAERLPGLARAADASLCLDLGHLLAYNQHAPTAARIEGLVDRLMDRTDMLHLNAPGPGGRHAPLTDLDARGRTAFGAMLRGLRPGATVVLELFEAGALLASGRRLCETAAALGLSRTSGHPDIEDASDK